MKVIIFPIVGIILFERIDGLKRNERDKPSAKYPSDGRNEKCSVSPSPLEKFLDIVRRTIAKSDCNTCQAMNDLTEICPVISNSTCFFACILHDLSQNKFIRFNLYTSNLIGNIANTLKDIGIELKECKNFQHIVNVIMNNFFKLVVKISEARINPKIAPEK
ncbi:uncharacterized protein LOC111630956 [Centruroides sculpturatus]|uniref:uncharacterized protein LOC111630956 n=1 Tax=Centruroides sculpturatus TaxID=218467 RepID=UPI000C6CA1F8|nr:uncharacterized protein LOC111630956 [Centruroides sculpturatus]